MRIVLLGNAGSGKSTLARKITGDAADIKRLSLDEIVWLDGTVRMPLIQSIDKHNLFIRENGYGL